MTNPEHTQWERRYVEFEQVYASTPSILDAVSEPNVSNYKKKVEVIVRHAFDLARGKNLSCARSIN
jgi:hypothetical protein